MIGKLSGRIDYRAADHVLIDVRGVGYLVYVSDRTMAALPGVGEAVALYTDLVVREDLMQLFGFQTLVEKEWHRLLTSVQGVGAKASLAILGTLGPDGVSRAIALGDWNAVKAAKGIGPKIAQRVVLDLKDKAPGVMAMTGTVADAMGETEAAADEAVIEAAAPRPAPKPAAPNASAQSEALSALGNLGYAPGDAAGAVAQATGETPEADTKALIRAALKLLAPKG
ncbi:Holliday junction branch migration protein RuvA [Sulfitobacter sp. KE34]|uniref:Holliday junction branch migration complex subunit RuvA n=1 Tax=Sulfitobacter faviae TaxID=1775881 RepID=A0AAX3LMF2_9RHOB|nr:MULTISPECIES: Holliday junction branch migration protein RuvA [Sulfitobacter]MDF3348811.1 Holliday junction branch migration protein RuvA [Sulfitobacter sp. KE12]MDF3352482.1 Holliday junction branch migration protein RuvA [Sulfitobacter sp. KE27]MDF3356129.1 Holliday junction branch migration protein RuvA [Sulfitobacter sp. KE33]MDF3360557.1 Holliday junction branch migration protein RuvA [Sulfitobacter sp. Ks41]MDF3363553.1 Holliday junction branch migration protein RuvA [Sulfitobacter sp